MRNHLARIERHAPRLPLRLQLPQHIFSQLDNKPQISRRTRSIHRPCRNLPAALRILTPSIRPYRTGHRTQHAVESVQLRPIDRRVAGSDENFPCGGHGVDDDDGQVAEGDLVDGAVGAAPLSEGFGWVGGELGVVS